MFHDLQRDAVIRIYLSNRNSIGSIGACRLTLSGDLDHLSTPQAKDLTTNSKAPKSWC